MAVRRVQVGQVWREDKTGDAYLVTRVFTEGLATYVLLRKGGDVSAPRVRLKVERDGEGQRLPGFSFAQGTE